VVFGILGWRALGQVDHCSTSKPSVAVDLHALCASGKAESPQSFRRVGKSLRNAAMPDLLPRRSLPTSIKQHAHQGVLSSGLAKDDRNGLIADACTAAWARGDLFT